MHLLKIKNHEQMLKYQGDGPHHNLKAMQSGEFHHQVTLDQ